MKTKNSIIIIITNFIHGFYEEENVPKISYLYQCINGFLSITVCYQYSYGEPESFEGELYRLVGIYDSYSATYDLYTGEKIKFSDLFFYKEDYSMEIYEFINAEVSRYKLSEYVKREFTVLPQDYENFNINYIIFNKKNNYFSEGLLLNSDYCTIYPITTIPRNMKEIFTDKITIKTKDWFNLRNQVLKMELNDTKFKIAQIKYYNKEIEEKVNSNIIKYMKFLIENKYLEQFARVENTNRSEKNAVSNGNIKNEILYLYVYYNSKYPYITMKIDMKTGKLIELFYCADLFTETMSLTEEEYTYIVSIDNDIEGKEEDKKQKITEYLIEKGKIKDLKFAFDALKNI